MVVSEAVTVWRKSVCVVQVLCMHRLHVWLRMTQVNADFFVVLFFIATVTVKHNHDAH